MDIMSNEFAIDKEETAYLRELANKCREYSELPVMRERKKLWFSHNTLQGELPLLVMEMDSFENDMFPEFRCHSEMAKEIEKNLLRPILNHEMIDDDKVFPSYYPVFWDIETDTFGVDVKITHAEDDHGRDIGFSYTHPILNIEKDLSKLRPSSFTIDRRKTQARKDFLEDIFGDIYPVKIKNNSLDWYVAPSKQVIELMGMENLMFAMIDYPEKVKELYSFLVDDTISFLRWQEQENLLFFNNGNDYTGAGSYGFTDELPGSLSDTGQGCVRTADLWGNMNSQETVGISPDMFGEFIYPSYRELSKEFGSVYFGCCEPVHDIWDQYISHLPNLKKVSVSAWCDEQFIGEALRGGKVIYSRKPKPNFIGVGVFNEEAFKEHIQFTLDSSYGCELEIIFRDIYALDGDLGKPGRAIRAVRELIEKKYC
jgi:hypothetical protein